MAVATKGGPGKTAATETDPIAEARAKVERLARLELDNYRRIQGLREDLSNAQQTGDFQKAAVLREEIIYREGPDVGRKARREAITELHRLQAEDLRRRATELHAQAAARRLKTDQALAALKEHEGVEFRSVYPAGEMSSQQMDAEAMSLEMQANQLLRTPVNEYGRVHGMNADELVAALLAMPDVLGPSVASIHAKASDPQLLAHTRGQRLTLEWSGMRILSLNGNGIIVGNGR